jgi:hypothetical protein
VLYALVTSSNRRLKRRDRAVARCRCTSPGASNRDWRDHLWSAAARGAGLLLDGKAPPANESAGQSTEWSFSVQTIRSPVVACWPPANSIDGPSMATRPRCCRWSQTRRHASVPRPGHELPGLASSLGLIDDCSALNVEGTTAWTGHDGDILIVRIDDGGGNRDGASCLTTRSTRLPDARQSAAQLRPSCRDLARAGYLQRGGLLAVSQPEQQARSGGADGSVGLAMAGDGDCPGLCRRGRSTTRSRHR